ncbi:MAG: FAD-dependent oxidoreductase [Elusimicrobiales bacterium]|nr:FAD-dependent oxidoreductase [Elusimicrobiales bacterium]
MSSGYDAIVVGAGAGGLSAALSLAGRGLKVLVAEKGGAPGGNCTSVTEGGYTFDLAVHQLSGAGGDGVCSSILKEYGVSDRVELRRVDPFLVVDMPDRSYEIRCGRAAFRDELVKAFPGDAGDIERMIDGLDSLRKDALIAQRIVYGGNRWMDEALRREIGAGKLLSFPFTAFAGLVLRQRSDADSVLRRWVRDPRLRAVVHASWPYLGLPPSRLSGLMMNIFVSMQHMCGGYYPAGGSQRLADAMAEALRRKGGELLLGAPVKRIVTEDGRARGVELEDGRRFASETVVSNTDILATYRRLLDPSSLPAGFLARLESMPPSIAPFRVCLGLDRDPSDEGLEHHEYMILPGYDHESTFAAMERGEVPGVSLYSPSRISPDLSPPGCGTLILTALMPWRPARDWRGREEEIASRMIEIAEKRRLPGLSSRVKVKKIMTPEDLFRITGSHMGAMYGWANTPGQTLMKRLSMYSPVKGLYHAGHWTRPGTGVTGAILSGWILGRRLASPAGRLFDRFFS